MLSRIICNHEIVIHNRNEQIDFALHEVLIPIMLRLIIEFVNGKKIIININLNSVCQVSRHLVDKMEQFVAESKIRSRYLVLTMVDVLLCF